MKRMVIALTAAGMSLMAFAGPPTDKPPVGPIDVTVSNTAANPVPVAVTPGILPTLAEIYNGASLILDAATDNTVQIACANISAPMRITGVTVWSSASESHAVSWGLNLKPMGSTDPYDEVIIAKGVIESRAFGPTLGVHKASVTLPASVVTPGYDKLCIAAMRSGPDEVSLMFSAVGEAL